MIVYLVQTSGSALVEMTAREIHELRSHGFNVKIVRFFKKG